MGNCGPGPAVEAPDQAADLGLSLVYLIDQDASVQDSLRTLGEVVGFQVVGFDSAERFLMALSTLRDGCIVCAAELPGMSGLSLYRTLRQRSVDLPFALLISHDDQSLRWSAIRAGIDPVLEKPRADQALLEFITRY